MGRRLTPPPHPTTNRAALAPGGIGVGLPLEPASLWVSFRADEDLSRRYVAGPGRIDAAPAGTPWPTQGPHIGATVLARARLLHYAISPTRPFLSVPTGMVCIPGSSAPVRWPRWCAGSVDRPSVRRQRRPNAREIAGASRFWRQRRVTSHLASCAANQRTSHQKLPWAPRGRNAARR